MNKKIYSNEDQKIAYQILKYLSKHPSAKDTLQGLAEWWILKEQIDQGLERLDRALDYLVSKGFVIIKLYHNQEKYYQINVEKEEEIKTILHK